MVWVLWRTGQNWQVAQHCESACNGYMNAEDRDSTSCTLCVMVRLYARHGERDEALIVCAHVRDLLGEPHWDGHDALEFVAFMEETLR